MTAPEHRQATCRRLIGAFVLALLLGQWAVLTHSIAHALAPAGMVASADADQPWGHKASKPVCDLIDHLLSGQAPGEQAFSAQHVSAAAVQVARPVQPLDPGPLSRAYDARGPPAA